MKRAKVRLMVPSSLFVAAALAVAGADTADTLRPSTKAFAAAVSRPGADGKEETPKHKYIGVQACARLCHSTTKQGQQLKKWQGFRHAKAFEVLASDEAKATAKKMGLETPPQEAPQCLRCHASGYSVPKEHLGSRFKVEDGVQCETCHGPGDDYKDKEIMEDRAKAVSLGLTVGDEALCRSCHNETAPSWDPERYTDKDGKKTGFDFEAAWKKIAHHRPKDDEKED